MTDIVVALAVSERTLGSLQDAVGITLRLGKLIKTKLSKIRNFNYVSLRIHIIPF